MQVMRCSAVVPRHWERRMLAMLCRACALALSSSSSIHARSISMITTTESRAGNLPMTADSVTHLNAIDWIAIVLMIIGGLNWGLVGAFDMDLVAALFGPMSPVSRVIYVLVGLAALYGIVTSARIARHRGNAVAS